MTTADNASVALRFNEATKLQYINLDNKPPLYKVYPGLRAIGLPGGSPGSRGRRCPRWPPSGAIILRTNPGPLTVEQLTSLLYHSAAVIRRRQLQDGEVHYRAAASAGALYPTEIYVVCGDLEGLRAGVYHFNPLDGTLAPTTEWRPAALGGQAPLATMPRIRPRWFSPPFSGAARGSTGERGYRYCYWDLGTIGANLLATANAEGGSRPSAVRVC